MLKGLAITPPILGRISIGKVVERNGKRLPEKDDQFTLTSQVQGRDGWVPHPLDEKLRQEQDGKLRAIPVRLMFNAADLNFRAEYTLFDRHHGRPVCSGDGEQCRRYGQGGYQTLPCPSPELCGLGQGGQCRPYGRLNVVVGDEDPLGSFVFRTTGFNSIRTLTARLQYFQALSNQRLACLPLELRLRIKSTRMSFGTPFFYADLTLRHAMTLQEALQQAEDLDRERRAAGFCQEALDEAARIGFGQAVFEETPEDSEEVMEEFFPEGSGREDSVGGRSEPNPEEKTGAKAVGKKEGKAVANAMENSESLAGSIMSSPGHASGGEETSRRRARLERPGPDRNAQAHPLPPNRPSLTEKLASRLEETSSDRAM